MLSTVIAGSKIVSGISVAKEFAPQSGQQQAEEQEPSQLFGGGREKAGVGWVPESVIIS